MEPGTWWSESDYARQYYKGMVKGGISCLLIYFSEFGLELSEEQRERITSCEDYDQLKRWFQRALKGDSVEQIFG
ncbi:hypothetical protein GCM10010191_41510 [Actinomadura vinacea]|uniref:Uncharacterized protein n=1 Tax=Actinomadura vinacea TaxID=115336 RepID=A0ABN3JAG4_9ACTN